MANIEVDGPNKTIKVDSGDLTLGIPGDIILDADGANVTFKDGGTSVLDLSNSSTDAVLTVSTQDKDLIIKGDDNGSAITAATFDMSDAGTLALNHDLRIADAGYIGSASDADAIAIASDGVVTFSQKPVSNSGIAIDNITIDGTEIDLSSGGLTLDVAGDIILDADGDDLIFAAAGTNLLKVTNSSSDVVFQPQVDAKDIKFNQYDGNLLLDINDGGWVGVHNAAAGPGQLRLYEDTDNGTNFTAFQVGTQSGDVTYTLPTADGSDGHALTTDGSGTLSWASAGASTVGAMTDVTMDATNFVDSFLIQTNSDGSAPTTGTLSSASHNIGIGKDVFKLLTSGSQNVVFGNTAADELTEGQENVLIGYGAGHKVTTGDANIAIGSGALDALTTHSKCTAIGLDALGWLNGSNSTAVGWQAGGSSAGASSLYLGYQSYGSGNADEIILTGSGNPISAGADTLTFGKNGNRVYNQFNTNNNWTHSSDERMKKNIQNETLGLSFINRLRPVTYNFRLPSEYPEDFEYYDANDKNAKTDKLQHGIIAQEVKAAMDAEGNTTFNGYQLANDGVHSVSESNFVYPMIKAIQELSAKIDALTARVTTLEG